jgi:hypothetical protein
MPFRPLVLTNDLNRLVSVYLLSVPIKRLLQGLPPVLAYPVEQRLLLLGDLITLMIYHQLNHLLIPLAVPLSVRDVCDSFLLITINGLVNQRVDFTTTIVTSAMVIIYNGYVKSWIQSRVADKYRFESLSDMLETVILLGVLDKDLPDILAKVISVFIHHALFKWRSPIDPPNRVDREASMCDN